MSPTNIRKTQMKYSSSKSSSTLGSFVPSIFSFCICDSVWIIFLTKVQACHFGWHQGLPAGRAALISLAIRPNPPWAFLFKLQNVFPVFFLSLNCISSDLISLAIRPNPLWAFLFKLQSVFSLSLNCISCDLISVAIKSRLVVPLAKYVCGKMWQNSFTVPAKKTPECRRTDDYCYGAWEKSTQHSMQWNGIKVDLDWDEFWKVNPLQNVFSDVILCNV